MTDSAWQTLFYPFEVGWLDMPPAGERWLFVGAAPGFRLPQGFAADLTVIQGFRPWFIYLAATGLKVEPQMGKARVAFDGALVLLGRHRGENENRLRDAAIAVKPGGWIVAAGSKNQGAASFVKRLAKDLPGLEHAAKHHGTVVWLARPDEETIVRGLPKPEAVPPVEGRFKTAPGMFSHGHADPGSKLLAAQIPQSGIGLAADFCAGWGYLSARLLERCPSVRELHLYEADYASLQAAKANLQNSGKTEISYFWHDLLSEKVEHRYDFIVMNPPFHTSRSAEPDIGRRMVDVASKSLHPRGRLLIVANKQLPYEAMLGACFARVERLCEDSGYKVILAHK